MESEKQHSISEVTWNHLQIRLLEKSIYCKQDNNQWNYKSICSPYNRMYILLNGEIYLDGENESYVLKKGQIYLVPAGSTYDYTCSQDMKHIFLHFNVELLPGMDLFGQMKKALIMPFTKEEGEEVLEYISEGSIESVLYLKEFMWKQVKNFYNEIKHKESYISYFRGFYKQKEVLEYLELHISSKLRMRDMARDLNTPVHRLSREFRQDTGLGLKEYMEKILMERACKMLQFSKMSISEIGEKVGFDDPLYFSRSFKNKIGCSPREYRKKKMDT